MRNKPFFSLLTLFVIIIGGIAVNSSAANATADTKLCSDYSIGRICITNYESGGDNVLRGHFNNTSSSSQDGHIDVYTCLGSSCTLVKQCDRTTVSPGATLNCDWNGGLADYTARADWVSHTTKSHYPSPIGSF